MELWENLLVCLYVLCPSLFGFMAVYGWIVDGCGKYSLYHCAVEAAEVGDTQQMLQYLRRMRVKAERNPAYPRPESMASGLIASACEWGYPATAQAVLDELGLPPEDLVWQEKDRPDIPFIKFLQETPELYPETLAFLRQQQCGEHS